MINVWRRGCETGSEAAKNFIVLEGEGEGCRAIRRARTRLAWAASGKEEQLRPKQNGPLGVRAVWLFAREEPGSWRTSDI